jgi:hypothetical protein
MNCDECDVLSHHPARDGAINGEQSPAKFNAPAIIWIQVKAQFEHAIM